MLSGYELNRKRTGISRLFSKDGERFLRISVAIGIFVAYSLCATKLLGTACPIKLLTGVSCPSCGMTHACMELAHFDFAAAFYAHPLFLFGLIGVALFIVAAMFPSLAKSRAVSVVGICIAGAFIAVYALRLIFRPSFLSELDYSYNSLLGLILRLFGVGE